MAHGPVDFMMIEFEDTSFCPSMAVGLQSLMSKNTIRVIDLLFVERNNGGELRALELGDLDADTFNAWNPIVSEIEGILTFADVEELAEYLPNDHSAVLVMFENVWAQEMSAIIAEAGGEVTVDVRIPGAVMAELDEAADHTNL